MGKNGGGFVVVVVGCCCFFGCVGFLFVFFNLFFCLMFFGRFVGFCFCFCVCVCVCVSHNLQSGLGHHTLGHLTGVSVHSTHCSFPLSRQPQTDRHKACVT